MTDSKNLAEEDDIMDYVISFGRTFNNGDMVLCYFSGHALQIDGNNYFMPTNDTVINSDEDIEVLGVNLNQVIDRLVENKPDCVFIIIFDCCRPYQQDRETDSNVHIQGLCRMNVPDERKIFIQFSCAINETSKDDFFNKYILLFISKKNLPVDEVFHDIVENVYHKRHTRLRPFSYNGLPNNEPIYLNLVPSCKYSLRRKTFT